MGNFQLHTGTLSAAITDVLWMAAGKGMITRLRRDTDLRQATMDAVGQFSVPSSDVHQLVVSTAPVDCHHALRSRQEIQASGLIKPMTRQMQRVVIVGSAPPFKQIEMVLMSGNRHRDFRRPVFDATAVGRENGNARSGAVVNGDGIMLSLALGGREVCISAVMMSIRQRGQVHQQLQAHAPL